MKMSPQQLNLSKYRQAIHLDERYTHDHDQLFSVEERNEVIEQLVNWVINEDKRTVTQELGRQIPGKRQVLRALLNIRKPGRLDGRFISLLDRLLQTETVERGIVYAQKLKPVTKTVTNICRKHGEKLVLWQGDITCLAVDAIVNAANHQMLGCFQPLHACIDNVIHSAAGPQMREDCHLIMSMQGELEKTGGSKITRAYNLPSKYVLHTVGPIVSQGTMLTSRQQTELESCYNSCLDLASQVEAVKSVAFCAISTGVYGFPKPEAAEIAVRTVEQWIDSNPDRFDTLLFCVFSKEDYEEYVRVFQGR